MVLLHLVHPSTALGNGTKVGGTAGVGIGMLANATKDYGIAIGGQSSSTADNGIAIGEIAQYQRIMVLLSVMVLVLQLLMVLQ